MNGQEKGIGKGRWPAEKDILLLLILFSWMPKQAYVQESKVTLNGYVKNLYMYYSPETAIPESELNYLWTNNVHNRLNFKWYSTSKLTTVIEMRNRLIFGNLVENFPIYKETVDVDYGLMDLSWIVAEEDSWFMHTMIDRFYLDYSSGKWQITAGRQRVNWGVNLVWNPNDIFNTFSYFDFDYEERPGSDAIRVQYYTGVTSSAELVYKPESNHAGSTIAGMYRFSKWDYDFQFLGGQAGNDWVVGGGFSGDIRGAGFRGELTHFEPRKSVSERATVASLSADYTFSSGWYIHSSVLYNSTGKTGKSGGMNVLFNPDLSAKQLSFARYSVFGQVSRPITPLFTGSVSGIVNPSDHSFYVGPSLSYSLLSNLELMLTGQLFFGEQGTEFGDIGQIAFGRLKWSF
ncbi:MAG: hypothetical protein H7X84_08055 [Verrucomicrobia bacterium]|nr:hypothetical protein [Prolixibacteraceae bacterium]